MTNARLAALLALAVAAPALAEDQHVDATATTLFTGRQDPRDGDLRTVVPVWELLSLHATRVNAPALDELQLHVSGWAAEDLGDLRGHRRTSGDVDLAYAEGQLLGRHLTLRAGRMLVVAGAQRPVQMDGVYAAGFGPHGIGLMAWGGEQVLPRFAEGVGDVLGGARAFWRASFDTEVGASITSTLDRGVLAREDAGLDAHVRVSDRVALVGYGLYSLWAARLAEASLAADVDAGHAVQVFVDARRTAPDLFLPANSILAVFSDETHDEAGGTVSWAATRALTARAGFHFLKTMEGNGQRADARVSANLLPARRFVVGGVFEELALPWNGYDNLRLFCARRFGDAWAATLDLDGYRFHERVNGFNRSVNATGTVQWRFAPRWRAVLAGVAGQTPFLDRRLELLGRVVYAFGAESAAEVWP